MAEGFNNDSDVMEGNDTKGSANIYYTLAMEKIRDVSANCAFMTCVIYYYLFVIYFL